MKKEGINLVCGIVLMTIGIFLLLITSFNITTFLFDIAIHDTHFVFTLLDFTFPFIIYFLITGLIHIHHKNKLRNSLSITFVILATLFFYFGFGKEIIENIHFFATKTPSKIYYSFNTFDANEFSLLSLILFTIIPKSILFINLFFSKNNPNSPK